MLMDTSTARLFVQIVLSMLMIGFWLWIAPETSGFARLTLIFIVACVIHTLVLAVRLIDRDDPLLAVSPNGVLLPEWICPDGPIAWKQVKSFRVIELHWPFLVPLFSYVAIRTGKARHFQATARLLPTAWLGLYLIPTRLLRGGAHGARQLVGMVERVRSEEPHDVAGQPLPGTDGVMIWAIIRNTVYPAASVGPGEEAVVAATRDVLLEQAGVYRDLLPEPIRQQVLASDPGKALAARGEEWGRQLAADAAQAAAPTQPRPRVFGKRSPSSPALPSGYRGVTLNGKPLG